MTDAQLKVLEKYGEEIQCWKAVEEVGELIQAIQSGDPGAIEEEMADVLVMLDCMIHIMGGLEDNLLESYREYRIDMLGECVKFIIRMAEARTKRTNAECENFKESLYKLYIVINKYKTGRVMLIKDRKLARLADRVARDCVM